MSTRSRPTAGSSIRSRRAPDAGHARTSTRSPPRSRRSSPCPECSSSSARPRGRSSSRATPTRRDWSVRGPLCEGWPIHDLIVEPGSGAILAGGGSPWYGPAVWRSEDLGETWTHSLEGLAYGDGAGRRRPIDDTVWSLATTPDGGDARRRRARRPVPQRGSRGDLVARRGPDQPRDADRPGARAPAA